MDLLYHRPPKWVKGPQDIYLRTVLKLGPEFISRFSCQLRQRDMSSKYIFETENKNASFSLKVSPFGHLQMSISIKCKVWRHSPKYLKSNQLKRRFKSYYCISI